MEKAKKILAQAKSNVADAHTAISDSVSTVAEARQTMETEREAIFAENASPDRKRETNVPKAGKGEREEERKKEKVIAPVNSPKPDTKQLSFPVVGIGASAGGLEALQTFFENIKEPLNAAFVIVQHLSPDHESFMGELLGRHTSIPLEFIKNGTRVEANHIYLIPPKVNITIRDGVLYHSEIIGHGLNLPIDIFFRSLAMDQQCNAVAIIMSGAGSDGTLGIRAVKEYGGITMVQEPRDAKFDGMPKSALFSSNTIDLVQSAADLAHELASYLRHPLFTHPCKVQRVASDNLSQYNRILAVLKEAKKIDFSAYRKETINRRLEKRISINRFSTLSDYVDYLVKTPEEVNILFHEILIGVTRFFRDNEAFVALEKICFPELFKNALNGELRIWVASCSTGEEAYSIAILLKEYMVQNRILADVKIFATDIDDKALKFAALGFYPQNVGSDIPPQYLAKYFSPRANGYQINPDIRSMIIFASQDLIDNPPFFKLDFVSCRNFLIYLCPEAQQRVLSSFYEGLKTGGFLFLGPSESLETLSKGFDTLDAKAKIFKKTDGYTPNYSPKIPMPLHLSMLENPPREPRRPLCQENSELLSILELIDNSFLPPSLVIDSEKNIFYAIRDGGKFLNISSGRVSTNLLKILPKDLCLIVSSLIRRAEKKENIISSEIMFNGKPMILRCKHIVPGTSGATYFYLCFEEITNGKNSFPGKYIDTANLSSRYQERIDELESAVHHQKESLKIAVEQLETSNEELQASNEELVASNEELQSSNEELQSVNEELYTVNIEHVRKLEEITELNYDYDNLLSNTQIGTLFLDSKMVVRKISRIASKITNIMQSDIGRPLSYFSLRMLYPRFVKDVERVNSTKKMIEKELLLQGKTYCMRIVPYLVEENAFKGIIISFVDLTDCKMRAIKEANANQEKFHTSASQLEAAVEMAKMAYFQINAKTRKVTGSKLLADLWPMKKGRVLHFEEWIDPADLKEINAQFSKLTDGLSNKVLLSFRSRYFGELQYYSICASISTNPTGDKVINGIIQNTTSVIQVQQRLEAQKRLWEKSINAIPVLFYAKDADDDLRYVFANHFFLESVDKRLEEVIGKTDEEITPLNGEFHDEDLQTLASEEALSFENKVLFSGKGIRFFHTTKRKNIGSDGHRLIMGIGSDVTEQHLMMQDMQTANQCLSALLESENPKDVLRKIMSGLCERMGASHCFWMSFDLTEWTVTCEYEYVRPGQGKKLFGKSSVPMHFSPRENWYQCYQEDKFLDIPDLSACEESVKLLGKHCGFSGKLKTKSLYSVGFRNKDTIEGAIGFLYTGERPRLSKERLSYLLSFSSNLFRNMLHLQMKKR